MKNKSKLIKPVFYSLLVVFILLVSYFSISFVHEVKRSWFLIAAIIGFIFLILGIVLIFLTWKSKLERKLKIFLFLTGGSSSAVLISVILHNFFYALGILSENIVVLKYLFEFLHAGFFLFGLLGCPIIFIVGVIGSLILFRKTEIKIIEKKFDEKKRKYKQ